MTYNCQSIHNLERRVCLGPKLTNWCIIWYIILDIIEDSRIDDTSIIVDDETGNHVITSTIVKTESFVTSNFDDSFGDYTNSLTTEKTSAPPSNIRDEQPEQVNYYDVSIFQGII